MSRVVGRDDAGFFVGCMGPRRVVGAGVGVAGGAAWCVRLAVTSSSSLLAGAAEYPAFGPDAGRPRTAAADGRGPTDPGRCRGQRTADGNTERPSCPGARRRTA